LSPAVLIEYLSKETNADMYLLGIQPAQVVLGEDMSDSVRNAVEQLAEIIKKEKNA